uniref:Translation initiation factor eIF2B subunit gamma n=1 Tax=Ananas comosus var. bracteatus TaxID=296719 RepID=A0A6V7PEW4_ANACO|nr:unnamed protein product [Ananas comosus var. bracteatus]
MSGFSSPPKSPSTSRAPAPDLPGPACTGATSPSTTSIERSHIAGFIGTHTMLQLLNEGSAFFFVLELLEASNLKDAIVEVEGEEAALCVGGWISSAYVDRLHVEIAAVPEDIGTAGALRAVAHHLTANDVLVVSGDLVSDVPPGAVAATHRRHGAAVTALRCPVPVSGPSDIGSSVGKDKAKKPIRCNIVGLDSTRQFLLHIASVLCSSRSDRCLRLLLLATSCGGRRGGGSA